MSFRKAVVTAASPTESHLPLQTLVDPEGVSRPALEILLDDLFAAGLDSAAVVIAPGKRDAYLNAAGARADRLTLIEQTEPRGYGHAVWTARDYTEDDPFVLLVGDHLFHSRKQTSCVAQLLEVAAGHDGCVSGVQPTHESQLHLYGTIGGRRVPSTPSVMEVTTMVEKPTPTLAEQELFISGLRAGNYYCFFGIHALTPKVMESLDRKVSALQEGETLGLTSTLAEIAHSEKYLAVEIDGQRFNIGERYGLLRAQLSLALAGPHRDEILSMLIEITATSRP
ncbi:UTP--glucose-1-phosphate uridylyltransferase [Haloferula helveola]|uniref:UTP--glucose-1-phosphate uridylyltransferase n=1 Tax=Haloferula helveola TaxID=490095 RepID=A0ABM7R7M9_9BACT|nr:UTP--glucose-1-phosphate uridylyltransferase [Haloferula helveola]